MTDYKEGVIDLDDTVLVITTLNNFLKYDPPCKNCLVKSMCIREITDIKPTYMIIKVCSKLKKFLVNKVGMIENLKGIK